MSDSESRETRVQTDGASASGSDRREALARLFAEVNSLAIRLRTAVGLRHREGERPAGELSVLEVLQRHGALTVPQIGRIRHTSRQNTQILVNRLVADRLLELVPNPAHARSALVQLTAAGKAWLESSVVRHDRRFESVLAQVKEGKISAAAECLREIRQLLTQEEPRGHADGSKGAGGGGRKISGEDRESAQETPTPDTRVPVEEETELPISLL